MCYTLQKRRNTALAINKIHGHGPCSQIGIQLQPKKAMVRLLWPLIWQQKALYVLYIANKTKFFSFKSGCVLRVPKRLKEDWLVVLRC